MSDVQIQCVNMRDFDNTICYAPEIVEFYPNHFRWVEKCKCENRAAIICQESDNIIACGILKPKYAELFILKICFFYVEKNYRKNGIGSSLLNKIREFAQNNGFTQIYLTINPQNSNMINFSKKYGFSESGTSKNGDVVFSIKIKEKR